MLTPFAGWFNAHRIADTGLQEADRALQRGMVGLAIGAVWLAQALTGHPVHARPWFVFVLAIATPIVAFLYRRHVLAHPTAIAMPLYFFLFLDPFLLVGVLVQDPETFAYLHPFVFVTIVRSGIRYGARTMYLAWGATLAASSALLTSPFWRTEIDLTFAFFLMLLCVPLIFSSLIHRIHNVRAIEEERARFEAAHEAILARSAFLAKVSHELRSPLQGIVSALDVLGMRRRPAVHANPDDELIGRIRRASALLNTHLRDMLTLAKGEAGHLEMRPEPFDAVALVASVAAAAEELARDKGLALVVETPAEAAFVVADGARIDQILTNLVLNSIRYTDSGEVRITMHPYDGEARMLHFVVADSGAGIPAARLPMLLSPDRAITGSERRGEGSGIGLAIVRTLVDHLGGEVAVTSELGRGTTFTIAIPAEPVDPGLAHDDQRDSPTGRVLVVDDRIDVLDALASVLDELGFESDRATSVPVAANLLASRPYDAALLDVEMPLGGGADLAAAARRGKGPNATTRFIGMSAGEADETVQRQFDACLAKPIDHAALRRILLGTGQGVRPSQPGLWTDAG